ncbi:MAG TPA: SAM-dependent methyltransferase [Nitrospiraceae bacterium]|jgi:tRNA1Val (adenine37-N6)-methyltransferase|nr:SAM-dependent methyltransferase [Nitrospiraceae bacterium]
MLTHDSISLRDAGVVTITQPGKGHRFTLDSILLADFCRLRPRDRVLEPGAGTGIISLLLAKKFSKISITAVEKLHLYSELCRKNIEENDASERIVLLEQDIRTIGKALGPVAFDAVVMNPPFRGSGTGRTSPVPERCAARQDEAGGLADWLALQTFLKNRGRFFIVFSAERSAELIAGLRSRRLEPKRLRFVHPYADKPAALVLVEAVKSAGTGTEVLPPLVVHETGGAYTEEVRGVFSQAP